MEGRAGCMLSAGRCSRAATVPHAQGRVPPAGRAVEHRRQAGPGLEPIRGPLLWRRRLGPARPRPGGAVMVTRLGPGPAGL
jgi:hypothetical protein